MAEETDKKPGFVLNKKNDDFDNTADSDFDENEDFVDDDFLEM